MESIEKQIDKSISNHKRGRIFFPINFVKFGSSAAVRQSLKRLESNGLLIRIAKGIYLYPKTHETLGILYPSIDHIAVAISKRDKTRIIPTGIQALNRLGISTQVPMNVVYLTDGAARLIKLKNGSIKFKKASPRVLAVKSDLNILVIQALREIGKDNVDQKVLKKIDGILKSVDPEDVNHDLKLVPAWIAEIMKKSLPKT